MQQAQSTRSQVIVRRTYNRPKEDGSFESWPETVSRVIKHQEWLWLRAAKLKELTYEMAVELSQLKQLMLDRKVLVSGRSLWLGGTDLAKRREASQFNCSFLEVKTVHDVVDGFWLLLQGCGVGFKPVRGTLNGFSKPLICTSTITPKAKADRKDYNEETVADDVWTISIGDSAEAWAKAIGKVLAGKYSDVSIINFDFSNIREAGNTLKGYGWVSSGYKPLEKAIYAIVNIMNKRADQLLSAIDIIDIMNHLGTCLSSRRSAEIALIDFEDHECSDFIKMKDNHFEDNPHRAQSNNSVMFNTRPSRKELRYFFARMVEAGGSDPAIINVEEAKRRAPWFHGVNPCAEILLGDKSFCNLTEVNLSAVYGTEGQSEMTLKKAMYLAGRANYRQTCVNLNDGVLQHTWHELNSFLHLCGVGVTGIMGWPLRNSAYSIATLAEWAKEGANSMANELGLPLPKAVTTIKPSGTLSKVMDSAEGIHNPIGLYVFNNVNFPSSSPLVKILKDHGYKCTVNPYDENNTLVTFPVKNRGDFTEVNGLWVNTESAIEQLGRYALWMEHYVDHNASITVYYSNDEVEDIINWLHDNWGKYVGVSFLPRQDYSKAAKDLGFPYLPQEVVSAKEFYDYVSGLRALPDNWMNANDDAGEIDSNECSTGGCPIR